MRSSSLRFVALALAALIASASHGATVSTCDEATLRTEMAGGGTVTFACDGTIGLSNTIIISVNTVLDATGHAVTVSGNNAVRIFRVDAGATLTLVHLTLADGVSDGTNSAAVDNPGSGGAIYNNQGTIYLIGCKLTNNVAMGSTNGGLGAGGAIYNDRGQLNATNTLFSNNYSVGGAGDRTHGHGLGGAICNATGDLVLVNCSFESNRAIGGGEGVYIRGRVTGGNASGGALYANGGTISAQRCAFNANLASAPLLGAWGGTPGSGFGGAICNDGGVIDIADSQGKANVAQCGWFAYLIQNYNTNGVAEGGCIYNTGTASMNRCGFEGNIASGYAGEVDLPHIVPGPGSGGAISSHGPAWIVNSLFAGNRALGGNGGRSPAARDPGGHASGGAIFTTDRTCITNCTLHANLAKGGEGSPSPFSGVYLAAGGSAYGGAICQRGGELQLAHVTAAGNSAVPGQGDPPGSAFGGGLAVSNASASLQNTILADSGSARNCSDAIRDDGNNISSDSSCNLTHSGSFNNTNARLGPLADYGGPTPTMALLAGSPAIDAANPAFCPAIDQRGIARPYGVGCDIGAFESAPPYTILGHIKGYLSPAGITLSVGGAAAPADSTGLYTIHGLSPGTYTVIPSAADAVFVLSNQVCTVGPDAVNADFRSYRSNAWEVISRSNSILGLVFAGATGQAWHVFVSTNLNDWVPSSTNVIPSSGILEFNEVTNQRQRFFKAVQP